MILQSSVPSSHEWRISYPSLLLHASPTSLFQHPLDIYYDLDNPRNIEIISCKQRIQRKYKTYNNLTINARVQSWEGVKTYRTLINIACE